MILSDYLLDGIIRDLVYFDEYDPRQIDTALVLVKTFETVELTVITVSSLDYVAETIIVTFSDKELGLRFINAADLSKTSVRLWLERGENVKLQQKQRPDLQTTEYLLSQLFKAERTTL